MKLTHRTARASRGRLSTALAVMAISISGLSLEAQAEYPAYWTHADGTYVRSSTGGCIRTRNWSEDKAVAECGDKAAAAVSKAEEKPAAAPASKPASAPVTTPAVAAAPVVAAVLSDSDKDGVVDDKDNCPDSPSDKPVDANGCTIVSVVLEDVQFENNSDALTAGSAMQLDKAVAAMKKYPDIRVEVQAHSDSNGAAAYNQDLSDRRANSVRDYMIGEGIAGDRLVAKGYGESQPIASNDTREGRAKNRRVEMKIIE